MNELRKKKTKKEIIYVIHVDLMSVFICFYQLSAIHVYNKNLHRKCQSAYGTLDCLEIIEGLRTELG